MEKEKILRAVLCHVQDEWAECLIKPENKPAAHHSLKVDIPLNIPLHNLPDYYPQSEKKDALAELRESCRKCRECPLASSATNLVFGEGNPETDIVFVGEAPGENEDILSRPFVGHAGRLLTKTLAEVGMSRAEVYICNILKHRPPGNRNPAPEEIQACTPHLEAQLKIISPKIIIALGNFSAQYLLDTKTGIMKLRGTVHNSRFGFPVFPTFHPAYILRNMTALPEFARDLETAIGIVKGMPQ